MLTPSLSAPSLLLPLIQELELGGGGLAAAGGGGADVDLSLLTSLLCTPEQLAEGEAAWDPETLLGIIGSELTSEEEARNAPPPGMAEKEDEDNGKGGGAPSS